LLTMRQAAEVGENIGNKPLIPCFSATAHSSKQSTSYEM
jgi:hypothetical protein